MDRIEDELAKEKISVATEHVTKNVATTLAKMMTDKQNKENT